MVDKIVHLDSDVPSIYFPIGKPPKGTCYFATETCIEHCPSGQQTNEHEKQTYKYFQSHTLKNITKKIQKEVKELTKNPRNVNMLQWFTWGDCPPHLTNLIVGIIFELHDLKIPQYGFTRNKELWERIPKKDSLSIGYTIEDLKEAKRVSKTSGKMTATPDFTTGYAQMIFNGQIVARCNGWWCILLKDEKVVETRESNCQTCLTASLQKKKGTGIKRSSYTTASYGGCY